MFVTKRRYFDFVTLFVYIKSVQNAEYLFMKVFLQMKLPPQSRRKGHAALTSYYIGLQKIKKGTLFYQLALVRTRRKRYPFFLSILLSLKKVGKGVKFQVII